MEDDAEQAIPFGERMALRRAGCPTAGAPASDSPGSHFPCSAARSSLKSPPTPLKSLFIGCGNAAVSPLRPPRETRWSNDLPPWFQTGNCLLRGSLYDRESVRQPPSSPILSLHP